MRLPAFAGGRPRLRGALSRASIASMRPPAFAGGRSPRAPTRRGAPRGFNEAAGFRRRKDARPGRCGAQAGVLQ